MRREHRWRKPDYVLKISTLNVRGCNSDCKKDLIGKMFREKGLDILALSETKLRSTKDNVVMFGDVEARISGINTGHASQGVAILVTEKLNKFITEWKGISPRIMWVKMKFAREKWVFISAYGPGSERTDEERERFWIELGECIGSFQDRENIVLMGDLNARVGDVAIDGIIGKFGVEGINESGSFLIDTCCEHQLTIGNTFFKKKECHKYTWERLVQGRVEERALMDYVIVSERAKESLIDVSVQRGAAGGESDHFLVKGVLKIGCAWKRARNFTGSKVVKMEVLEDEQKMYEFQRRIAARWAQKRSTEMATVEEEWREFKECVYLNAKEVCGERRMGAGRRTGSEWWNEEARSAVEEKKRRYERYLQERSVQGRAHELYESYKVMRNDAKRKVKLAKKQADERWGEKVTEKFWLNKKMFWKEAKKLRREGQKSVTAIRKENGQMTEGEEQEKGRWAQYFESLLNNPGEREAVITSASFGRTETRDESVRDRTIGIEEVERALDRMKTGKAPGLDGIAAECLKKGGTALTEWMVRLVNYSFESGEVPMDWMSACVVPLYKGKGDRHECSSYRGISLLCVPGKVYARILIDRVRILTNGKVGEEQAGFREGRGCTDQIFVVRQINEKYLAKEKRVFWAFMDLEKAYDKVDREAMWKVLQIYGVGGKLLTAVKSFYKEGRACVRSTNGNSDWFAVRVGLRQGCVMSPWLFNIYMDGVVREVKNWVMHRGLPMIGEDGREWQINQILFADDTALVAVTEERLQMLVEAFNTVCKRRGLKVNVGKSKVMMCDRDGSQRSLNVTMEGERLEQVDSFKYLGTHIAADGRMDVEVNYRVNEGMKTIGVLNKMWKNKKVTMEAKKRLYEGVVVPTAMYGSETWVLDNRQRRRFDVMEMKCLRSMVGVSRREHIRNEVIRRRAGVMQDLSGRVDRAILRWFGHIERMPDGRMTKRVYQSEVEGSRPRGRPRTEWLQGSVKRALQCRVPDMTIERARGMVGDRDSWREFVRM